MNVPLRPDIRIVSFHLLPCIYSRIHRPIMYKNNERGVYYLYTSLQLEGDLGVYMIRL